MTELHLSGRADATTEPSERDRDGLLPPVVLDEVAADPQPLGWSPTEWRRSDRDDDDR